MRLSKHILSAILSWSSQGVKRKQLRSQKLGLIWDLGTENFVNYVGIVICREKRRPTKKTEFEIFHKNKLHIHSVVITLLFGFVIIFNNYSASPITLQVLSSKGTIRTTQDTKALTDREGVREGGLVPPELWLIRIHKSFSLRSSINEAIVRDYSYICRLVMNSQLWGIFWKKERAPMSGKPPARRLPPIT